jgi:tRNA-dihydrouridine synthase 1
MIRAVKAAVNIPVFANGNIMCYDNVDECIRQTHVDGVMSAEGMLSNPYLFDDGGLHRPTWIAANEYLDYATVYTPPISSIRAHLFKFFHHRFVRCRFCCIFIIF